jgi:hypothetical protein
MRLFIPVLTGFLFCRGVSATAEETIALLHAEPAEVDFGQAGPQQLHEAKVRLTNAGRKSVTVTSVSTDCGCTSASLSKTTLSPGEVSTLTIKLETQAESGNIHRMVIVHASSGDVAIAVKIVVVPAAPS